MFFQNQALSESGRVTIVSQRDSSRVTKNRESCRVIDSCHTITALRILWEVSDFGSQKFGLTPVKQKW